MSSISSIGSHSPLFQPTAPAGTPADPATIAAEKAAAEKKAAATNSDPDHDGDSDGPGLDVKA
jgi:hypothetical protein